jgi:siroheme synthase
VKAIAEGRNPQTPVALVYNVSLPDQKEYITDLEALSQSETQYPTPIIIVIGEVVSSRINVASTIESLIHQHAF